MFGTYGMLDKFLDKQGQVLLLYKFSISSFVFHMFGKYGMVDKFLDNQGQVLHANKFQIPLSVSSKDDLKDVLGKSYI